MGANVKAQFVKSPKPLWILVAPRVRDDGEHESLERLIIEHGPLEGRAHRAGRTRGDQRAGPAFRGCVVELTLRIYNEF
jgi:hypothetical protein